MATSHQGVTTVYPDKSGDWRWRAKCGGRVVAESGEGYRRRGYCATQATTYGPAGFRLVIQDAPPQYGGTDRNIARLARGVRRL